MTHIQVQRRRSPDWVRLMATQSLHGLGRRLQMEFRNLGLSHGQERLLNQVISELEWRHTHPDDWVTCRCDLCVPPFEWIPLDLLEPTGENVEDQEL